MRHGAANFALAMCVLAALIPAAILAQAGPEMRALPRGYICYRATGPIRADGRLDEPSWFNVPWTDPFQDIEGPERKPDPRFRTRAKMLWDEERFYVAASLDEPHVWATLKERDCVIFQDNDFEIFIDPDGDNHAYYEIEMNALNTVWDLLLDKPYRDGGPARNEWDIEGLRTGVHVRGTRNDPTDIDEGWSVEVAFPWKALAEHAGPRACPPRDGDQWRINFSRVEWTFEIEGGKYVKLPDAKEDNWVWSPQGVVDMHRPEHWGFVQFSAKAFRAKGPDAVFRRDPTQAAREALIGLYHAQREFREKNGRWAATVEELERTPAPSGSSPPRRMPAGVVLAATPEGYTATLRVSVPGGESRAVTIAQDSKITSE
ncbi:MAG: carbohydrate-binding family 9-like protein [Planctomycetes bacterium]|nr:carbohydrate-binding family 9-like protein [Planctomycetota bacterium]